MLKLLVEQRQLLVVDPHTIDELATFSRKGNSYEAEVGCHDDMVMSLLLFAWMSDQRYFKDLTNISTLHVLRDRTDEDLINELDTFFMDDGRGPDDIPDIVDLTEGPNREFLFF